MVGVNVPIPVPPDSDRFEHQVIAISAERPVYWISAESCSDPAESRLQLTTCENGTIAGRWSLACFHPHGAWLEWTLARLFTTGIAAAPEDATRLDARLYLRPSGGRAADGLHAPGTRRAGL
jgi:Uncharacterized protein conserved in bacteria (DUF2332)